MGRINKPTKLKILKGTYRHYRENPNEPMPENPLGEPPISLTDVQQEAWHEIAELIPDGVLTEADRIIVEIAARFLSDLRLKGSLSVGNMGHLMIALGRMGLTPADRPKVSVQKKTGKNKWEKYG